MNLYIHHWITKERVTDTSKGTSLIKEQIVTCGDIDQAIESYYQEEAPWLEYKHTYELSNDHQTYKIINIEEIIREKKDV